MARNDIVITQLGDTRKASTTLAVASFHVVDILVEDNMSRFIHGKSYTKTYKNWSCMVQRCVNKRNPRFSSYGGRGITVCDSWARFENFFSDMGEMPKGKSIDRMDNNKGYSPDNCRWSTAKEQQRNGRRSRRWIIGWRVFGSAQAASDYFGIEVTSIQYACKGRLLKGQRAKPKYNCISERIYQ